MDGNFKKMLQKRVYDLLSHKYGILIMLAGGFLLTMSAFHFGEAWLEWSQEKYEAVFNSFSDNIAGKSFRDRLSVPLPIDVVYTWVNGTDPDLIRQLELVKMSLDKTSNVSREEHCTYTNCLCVGVIVYPPLFSNITLTDIKDTDTVFRNITGIRPVHEFRDGPANFTLLSLENDDDAKSIVKSKIGGWSYRGVNYTIKPAFYTSEMDLPHGLLVPETIMMSGFPSGYTEADIHEVVMKRISVQNKTFLEVKLYADKGMALLHLVQSSRYDILVKDKNFTIDGKELRLSQVKLVWDLKFAVTDDVVAANRFEDNEELRYSLRSVEQFAPWVRHIYIVTNGQIPYWLNLDSPRLTVVTHEEIFANQSHLPTFSSPAIEANIHRIPGLSDKFLYLNDDVMFGAPVWPDDFYTHSTGQKLYLTWPVPNCNEGCPSTWIRDGYCDKACNSSECDWDGGDCLQSRGQVQLGAGFHSDQNYLSDYTSYCATGCANNWLSDKYCDQACNNLDCGYDIGDCGTENYDKLYDLNLQSGKTHYVLPPGELLGYLNLTELVGDKGKVTEAKYVSNGAVRAAAVANKFKVMTIILNKGQNATAVKFDLTYTKGENHTAKMNLTVEVDTSVAKVQRNESHSKSKIKEGKLSPDDELDAQAFQGVPYVLRNPVVPSDGADKREKLDHLQPLELGADILTFYSEVDMSDGLREALQTLDTANKEGEFTDLGMRIRLMEIQSQFGLELESLKAKFAEQKEKVARQAQMKEDNKNLVKKDPTLLGFVGKADKLKLKVGETEEDRPNNRILGEIATEDLQQEQQKQQQEQEEQPYPQDLHERQKHEAEVDQAKVGDSGRLQDGDSLKIKKFEPSMKLGITPSPRRQKGSIALGSRINRSAGTLQSEGHAQGLVQKFAQVQNPGQGHVEGKAQVESLSQSQGQIGDIKGAAHVLGGLSANQSEGLWSNDGVQAPGRKLLAVLFWSDHLARLEREREESRSRTLDDDPGQEMSDEEFLRLVDIDGSEDDVGGFPWEKNDLSKDEKNERESERKANQYVVEGWQGRQLLDTFGDSLRHVNRIYNKEFGFTARKVPGHMPHMVDKNIMQELQDRFPKEWDTTSSHKIRSSTDMQYAFAYYYYLMGVTEVLTVEDVFKKIDTDRSGVLSDREIRTLAAKMFELPLYLEVLTGLEKTLINCSQHLIDPTLTSLTEEQVEQYYDHEMPQVTQYLFCNCDELVTQVKDKFKPTHKYKTTVLDDGDIAFKMIHTNVSHVVGQLDDIRKHSKKFICLNDNIDHTKDEAKTVKAILQDFYESLVPTPSQFELPRDYRNRFLHTDELREWRTYRDRLRFWTHVALIILVVLTVVSFLGDKIENWKRKWMNRKRRRRQTSSSSESTPPSSVSVSPTPQAEEESSSLWGLQPAVETV